MNISLRVAWFAFGLVFCACGSSPNTNYYALAVVSGQVRQASLGTIEVRRPAIAGYLDRTEILAQWDGHRLQLVSNCGWAEPITEMIGRVLAEDLDDRLQGSFVLASSSDLSLPTNTAIELVIRKFDLGSDGNLQLNVLASIRRAGRSSPHEFALRARPASRQTDAIVAAMSSLLGQLADELAKLLVANGALGAEPCQ